MQLMNNNVGPDMLSFVDCVRFGGGCRRRVVVTDCGRTIILHCAVQGGCQVFVKRISVIQVYEKNTFISCIIVCCTIIGINIS